MKRTFVTAALVGVSLLAMDAAALAQSSANTLQPTTPRAQRVCWYLENVIFGRKPRQLDKMGDYLTAGYIEHNSRMSGVGLEHKRNTMAPMPAFGPPQGCGAFSQIIDEGNYVTFISETRTKNAEGKEVVGSHFDVFRFEGDKIAEHWD